MAGPEPILVPPQEPVYHCQFAPVPNTPPTWVSVVEFPLQMGLDVADILAAAVEFVFTVTVTLAHAVVLHVPSARI